MSSLKFGTSGLRGLAVELDGPPAYIFARAFAQLMRERDPLTRNILIARDLRSSSANIARLCMAGCTDAGLIPIDCGAAPTPALALAAQTLGHGAIMVTGSHIPDDRNGLKFYRPDGEIDKQDEQVIGTAAKHLSAMPLSWGEANCKQFDIITPYKKRYVDFFGEQTLQGIVVGVYQHSSVARDVFMQLLTELGAKACALGRSDVFIPVDTEALRPEDRILARQWAQESHLDAIVSTDGDADRPLIADETGAFLRGDLVGAATAQFLAAEAIATPVTSNSALEKCKFSAVFRTKVGSPYVIEAMASALQQGAKSVVGFEANGGVLLGSNIVKAGKVLSALPTRDAATPILCLLAQIKPQKSLSQIARDLAFFCALSDRIPEVPQEKSAAFLERLRQDEAFLTQSFANFGGIIQRNELDGLRLTTGQGDIMHFRRSGNAPELRVYVEAKGDERAAQLLAFGLNLARNAVKG